MAAFIAFQAPLHDSLAAYDAQKSPAEQEASIAETFVDAMLVRAQVFVQEQNVPAINEFDADDPRSFHWVVYASVAAAAQASGPSPPPSTPPQQASSSISSSSISSSSISSSSISSSSISSSTGRIRKGSTATNLPVGTIRFVPPPHRDDHSGRPCNSEPYVKLGRMAVVAGFRGLGLARLLVAAALEYAGEHAEEMVGPVSPMVVEGAAAAAHRLVGGMGVGMGTAVEDGDGEKKVVQDDGLVDGSWKGLVLVHAQVQVEAIWARWGFVRDESMGEWDEEGIRHVGMWRRVGITAR